MSLTSMATPCGFMCVTSFYARHRWQRLENRPQPRRNDVNCHKSRDDVRRSERDIKFVVGRRRVPTDSSDVLQARAFTGETCGVHSAHRKPFAFKSQFICSWKVLLLALSSGNWSAIPRSHVASLDRCLDFPCINSTAVAMIQCAARCWPSFVPLHSCRYVERTLASQFQGRAGMRVHSYVRFVEFYACV